MLPSFSLPRRWQTPHYVQGAIVFLGLLLVLQTLGAAALMRHLVDLQERQVGAYLEPVARGIAEPPRLYFWFLDLLTDSTTGRIDEDALADYSALEDWRQLAFSLRGEGATPFISHIHLLTLAGEVIMDGEGQVLPRDEAAALFADEAAAIATVASSGRSLAVPMARGIPPAPPRLYHPVRNEAGRLVAILRVEANADYLADLVQLRRNIFFGFIVTNVLLLVVYGLTMKLVRRTLEAERAAARSDRLRALGTLTAGIAHEIRNPLGIISLQAEEVKACLPAITDPPTRAVLEEVAADLKAETRRLKELTDTFLQFTRPAAHDGADQRAVPVNDAVGALVKLWQRGLPPERRTVQFAPHPDPAAAVLFTEDRLRQVLLNLLRNADEALGERHGTVCITVIPREAMVEIAVEDDGPGIAPPVLDQIFDPFFTTRAEGTGLGLSLSRTMARHAGGDLTATSTPGRGSRFALTLKQAPGA